MSMIFEKLGFYSANIFYLHSTFYNNVFPAWGISNPYLAFALCFVISLSLAVAIEAIKKKTEFNRKLRSGLDNVLKIGN